MRAEDNSQMNTLSQQSFEVVMTAIKNAKLKGHSQVQPLHVAAALLDPFTRSTALHNACLHSLKEPPHPLNCDALDVCFKVALDRLPVVTDPDKCKEQTMSNALGAALKRAHANERRGTPEQSLQPMLAVKTGIAHLTISILDDPSVNRVFREAGFSSTDVKLNMEEQVAKAALAGPVGLPLDNPGTRRMQVPMPRFCGARSESVQFRNSFFSSSIGVGDPLSNQGKLLERGRMNGNGMSVLAAERESSFFGGGIARDHDAVSFGFAPPKFLELPQQKGERQPWIVGGPAANSPLKTYRHEADIRNIVETVLYGAKKQNPVLVSDSGSNLVLKEFSQRVMRGDTPSLLSGVRVVDLPFTSLSVGMLSQEAFKQKIAKLKKDVDGMIQTGGIILSVGDCQWLLEPSQSRSSLLVQELEQLVSSNVDNRFWLLASVSSKVWERCRVSSQALLQSLALHPVHLAPDSPASSLELRHGSIHSMKNGEVPFRTQAIGGKLADFRPATIPSRPEKLDCCSDCYSKFQEECATLVKEENTGRTGASLPFSNVIWMQNGLLKNSAALPVKEEDYQVMTTVEVLREKWQQRCSTRHVQRGFARDHSGSPVAEIVSPQERNPRVSVAIPPAPVPSRWVPHPVKISEEKSSGCIPLHARMGRGNMPNFFGSGSKPDISSRIGEPEIKRRDDSSGSPVTFLRRDAGGVNEVALSTRLNCPVGKSGLSGGLLETDLALGRSASVLRRNLREDGQQPLRSPNNNPKGFKMDAHSSMVRASEMENLRWNLSNAVAWQKEAVGSVAATVAKCRSGVGRKTGPQSRNGTWMMFLGPDRVGKREVAKAVAKCVFGVEDNLIVVTGWRTDATGRTGSTKGILAADHKGLEYTGNTPLDRLVEALQRMPVCVVLLEDIDLADAAFKRSLVRAMERGRLVDPTGRDASLANNVVIMTCGAGASLLSNNPPPTRNKAVEFDEDGLYELGPHAVRLYKDTTAGVNLLRTTGKRLSIVDCIKTGQVQGALKKEKHQGKGEEKKKDDSEPKSILLFGLQMFKRKADSMTQDDTTDSPRPLGKARKKEECSPKAFSLDLNRSVEENLSEDEEPCITDELSEMSEPKTRELSEMSEPKTLEELTVKVIECARERCPVEMFNLSDAAVVFKPFNINGLTDWVLDKLESALEQVMHTNKTPVEVDRTFLEMLVSFAWKNSSNPDAVQGWVDNVLTKAVAGFLEKGSLPSDAIVKLTAAEMHLIESPKFTANGSASSKVDLLPANIRVDQ